MIANKTGFGPLKGPDRGIGTRVAMAYVENAAEVAVSNGAQVSTMQLGVVTTGFSHGFAGYNLQGTASADMNLRVDVMRSGAVSASFLTRLKAGPNTVAAPFVLLGLPPGEFNWTLRLTADGGTWTMPANLSSWWIESTAIDNDLVAADPSQSIVEIVDITDLSDVATVASPVVGLQVPIPVTVQQDADVGLLQVDDSIGINFGFQPGTSNADGWVSDSPDFDNTSNLLQAGNSSGEIREAFLLFDLPMDIAGVTILEAKLTLTPDSNMAQAVELRVFAEDAGAPAAITSRADYDSRVLTTASVPWYTTSVAGTPLTTPDFSVVVQELVDTHVSVTKLQLVIKDGPAALNQWLTFRAAEHPSGPVPSLSLLWE